MKRTKASKPAFLVLDKVWIIFLDSVYKGQAMSLSNESETLSTKTLAINAKDAEVLAAGAFKAKVIEDSRAGVGPAKAWLTAAQAAETMAMAWVAIAEAETVMARAMAEAAKLRTAMAMAAKSRAMAEGDVLG